MLRGRARGGDDTPTSTGLYVSTDEQETDEEVMRNMNKLRLNGLKVRSRVRSRLEDIIEVL